MTPADLKAKSDKLILEFGVAKAAHAVNREKYLLAEVNETRKDLTDFIGALIECQKALKAQCDTGCGCENCVTGRAALSGLKGLLK